MTSALFSQLTTLGSSVVLLFGIVLLCRRSLHAYVEVFRWQSLVLSALVIVVGRFGNAPDLYFVGVVFLAIKGIFIPRYLERLAKSVGAESESQPYVNITSSLVIAALLVLSAYVVMRPLVLATQLPTRGGMPLALGLIFVGLFVLISRKKALTQIVGFLVLENGIALLAVLGTFGIPLIVEMGVFLDLLMGFLVMQVFVYHIHGTFESIDVEQLNQLRH
jgi:hydrogenase-4 component E